MTADPRDPRSEAEKARAALMRNEAMGLGVPESPIEEQPSVTPKTFGDASEAGQVRSGTDQGLEAGGARPAGDRQAGDAASSEAPAAAQQVSANRDRTVPHRQNTSDEDVLSRAKE
ncbi:MAG TPA: hypothetical protein VHG30_14960 [Microvirga sp.]|jgi:hypothetical protein|nr:hypothetical protein [Microvirga sp.]